MKLFGLILETERQRQTDLRSAEDQALSRLVELLKQKDSIYLDTVTLEGDGQMIENNVFLGPCSGVPGLVINTSPKRDPMFEEKMEIWREMVRRTEALEQREHSHPLGVGSLARRG